MRARALDDLLGLVRPVRDGRVLTVDLRGVGWVTPATMVAVAALAHRSTEAGRAFAVRGPTDERPAGYAARMRLGRVLSALGAQHDLPEARERDQSANLVELTTIETEREAARLARLVHRKVQSYDPELADVLHRSIGEVGVNVPDHAGTVGFMAAQTMPRRNTLLLAVADAGAGLLATLSGRGARDHEDAIEYATRPDVSQYDDPTRGGGLPATLRLVRAVGGSVYIASGDASIRHYARSRRYQRCDVAYPGTIVEVRIPLAARAAADPAVHPDETVRR